MERDSREEDIGGPDTVQPTVWLAPDFDLTAPSTATEASLLLDLLEGVGCGACVVDEAGTALMSNASFRHVFATSMSSEMSGGALPRVLRQVSTDPTSTFVSEIEDAHGRVQRLLVRCFPVQHQRLGPRLRMLLAVQIGRCIAPSIRVLQQVFGLTPAEARIAACIGAGQDVKHAAASSNVSVGTARAYLKTVFEKTHTRRQAELTAVLGRLSFIASLATNGEGSPLA